MELEASTSEVAKKLWNIARIAVMMMRKGISKSKIMMELNLLMKRGKLAGKAMAENFIDNYHNHSILAGSSFSCRSNDAVSFISPRDYEFSCSNSPAFHHHSHHKRGGKNRTHHYHDMSSAVQKMLEMYYSNQYGPSDNNYPTAVEASPMVYLPGFGKSPVVPVRQLRITDSPFPLKDEGLGDVQVDRKADDFIKKFYKDLKKQTKKSSMAYLESPYREVYG